MAIFGTSKNKSSKQEQKAGARKHSARRAKLASGKEHEVIRAPWLSEKALLSTEKGVYAFEVSKDSTKAEIAGAVKALYKVEPKRVRVVNVPGKTKAMRTRRGFGKTSARRKAYIYLAAGDTIQFA